MRIVVSISHQTLTVFNPQGERVVQYSISTATKGAGCLKNSACTPLGKHIIRAKIGEGAPLGAVFVGRRQTGEICTPELMQAFPNRDWILTRILWLSGTEIGLNRLGDVDTMQRYIYIHGTPDSSKMGVAASHGCVRMRNHELVELFDMVQVGVEVEITP